MSKTKIKPIQIIFPVIIILLIAGIFIVKNIDKKEVQNENSSSLSSHSDGIDYSYVMTTLSIPTLTSQGKPLLIEFGSEGCEPCRQMEPILIKLNEEWTGKALVKFIDVWKYPEQITKDIPLTLIPTQFFFDKYGNPYTPSEALKSELEKESVFFELYKSPENSEHEYTFHQGTLTEEQLRKIYAEMDVK